MGLLSALPVPGGLVVVRMMQGGPLLSGHSAMTPCKAFSLTIL